MCGILGFAGDDIVLAKKMAESMSHRGPDGEGVFSDERLTLGHRRLAVIDLSPKAAQPMWSSEKTLGIIFNGEIYNFKELRKNLEDAGERFVTDSDTEVILVGFKKEGKAFFSKMRGMWALALYDREKGELTLSRDPFGDIFRVARYHSGLDAKTLQSLNRLPRLFADDVSESDSSENFFRGQNKNNRLALRRQIVNLFLIIFI